MSLNEKIIYSIDTETYWDMDILMNRPFIATTTDQRLQSKLYDLTKQDDIEELKKIAENPNIVKVFHNASYDITCLKQVGINVCVPIEDTMIMASIVNENFSSKKLKDLAKNYLKEECKENEDLKRIKAQICRQKGITADDFQYNMIPPEVLYPYALKDTEYTIKLFYYFYNQLEEFRDVYQLELDLIPIIVDMQMNGIKIDRDFLADRIIKFGTERNQEHDKAIAEVKKLEIIFYKKVSKAKTIEVPFNPRSPKHLGIIWEKLELPVLARTAKGSISTSRKIMDEFFENEENTKKYNITALRHIARYKFLDKQLGTYAIPLYLHYTDEGENKDRAHFNFWQSGAKTGRFSAELIQTMPRIDHDKGIEDVRMIRFAFKPEDDHILAFIDYEQIEMRLFAHWSQSELLIKDLNNGFDPHMGTVYNVFPKDLIDSNPVIRDTFRSMIKAINFGILYGMGRAALIFKIKDMIYRASHVNPEVREKFDEVLNNIDGVLRTYYSKYPADVYQQNVVSELYRKGYVEIEMKSELMNVRRVYRTPKQMAYKAVNMIVQGSAAYCMKAGMKRAYDWIIENPQYGIKLLLTIHDELVFEISKQQPYVAIMLKLQELMEDKKTFTIPIEASIKATEKNWGSAYGLAHDGKCKKHGQLEFVEEKYNIMYCKECKKKYIYVPVQERIN